MTLDPAATLPARKRYRERALNGIHLPVSAYVLYIGARTILDPASSSVIDTAFPWWLTHVWAGALTLGALLIFFGTVTGWLRTEQAGHLFHLAGLGIYAVIAAVAGLFGSTLLVVLVALGGVSLLRSRQVGRDRDALQEATRILNGEDR